jgi:hypothetical protein
VFTLLNIFENFTKPRLFACVTGVVKFNILESVFGLEFIFERFDETVDVESKDIIMFENK